MGNRMTMNQIKGWTMFSFFFFFFSLSMVVIVNGGSLKSVPFGWYGSLNDPPFLQYSRSVCWTIGRLQTKCIHMMRIVLKFKFHLSRKEGKMIGRKRKKKYMMRQITIIWFKKEQIFLLSCSFSALIQIECKEWRRSRRGNGMDCQWKQIHYNQMNFVKSLGHEQWTVHWE